MINATDTIVIASCLASRAEITLDDQIETISTFSVEEVLKGKLPSQTLDVRAPGGVVDDRETLIHGAPRFHNGTRYLLFLSPSGDIWAVRDLVLGKFTFATDAMGNRVALRDEAEINGFNQDAQTRHLEKRRGADSFVRFIRNVVKGAPAIDDYFVPRSPVRRIESTSTDGFFPFVTATYTANSYTFRIGSGDRGARWNVFPSPVNFYQVGNEPGAPGGGTTAINAAFAAWNNEPNSNVNYVLAGTSTAGGGITTADGVNAIAFERDLTRYGVARFQCSSNSYSGTLGLGGVTNASGTHTHPNGETFVTTREGDVEMNQGIANCSFLFSGGDFNSGVAHEVGHTLGFRHSDQTRAQDPSIPCTSDPSLDCATTAIMKSFVTTGLNATLQPWDQRAVAAIYPSSGSGGGGVPPGGGTLPPVSFTDDPLQPRVTVIKAIHLAELRNAVNAIRAQAGLGAFAFTDPATPGIVIKAIHINQLRTALDEAMARLGRTTGGYTDTLGPGVVIKAVHFQELRNRMK